MRPSLRSESSNWGRVILAVFDLQKDLSGTRLGHGDVLNPGALAALMHRTFCLGARLEVVVSLESGGVARSHRRIGIPLASGGVEGAPKIQ